jgi:hypothetical protein
MVKRLVDFALQAVKGIPLRRYAAKEQLRKNTAGSTKPT